MNKDEIRVLLVDDHLVVREGLRAILSSEPGIKVLNDASSGEEAIQMAKKEVPHIVLMDIRMPGMGGIEATRRIKEEHPNISIIVLTMYGSEIYVVEALRAGAAGYLVKDTSRELLLHAIRVALKGGTLVRRDLLRMAIQGSSGKPKPLNEESDPGLLDHLTPREKEILAFLAQGQGNKAIRATLNLAEITVKKHVQNIISKLGVSDRTQAAIKAVRMGLVE